MAPQSLRIYLLGGDTFTRESLEQDLSREGFEVTHCHSASEALEFMLRDDFEVDAIISDIKTRSLTRSDVLRIKEEGGPKKPAIILISTRTDFLPAVEDLQVADEFISTASDTRELVNAILYYAEIRRKQLTPKNSR